MPQPKLSPNAYLDIQGATAILPLKNDGDADLEVTSIKVTGVDLSLNIPVSARVGATLPLTIGKGETRSVELVLLPPPVTGSGTIAIESNGGNEIVAFGVNLKTGGKAGQNPLHESGPPEEGGGGCFAPDTCVLGADGRGRRIAELSAGDEIATILEDDHLASRRALARATVREVLRHPEPHPLIDIAGVRTTGNHRWATESRFAAASALGSARVVRVEGGEAACVDAPAAVDRGEIAEEVYNLETTARTYLVGASASGPWYLVHNAKDPHAGPVIDNPPTPDKL